MTEYFRVTAKGLIYDGDRVLLIRKPIGVWDLPGGRLQAGEDPESTLRREIHEELGVDGEVGRLADCAIRPRANNVNVVVVSYHSSINGRIDEIQLSEEHTEAHFFAVSDVPWLDMHDAYKTAIQRGFAGQRDGTPAINFLDPGPRILSFSSPSKRTLSRP